MLWVFVLHECKSLSYKPRSRWDRVMLQYALTSGLIQFTLHIVKFPDFTIGKSLLYHNRSSFMLYDWYDLRGCSSLSNTSLPMDPDYLTEIIRTLIHPSKGVPSCPIFASLGPLEPFDIVLLPQQWFLDSNSAKHVRFIRSSTHSGCWHIFSRHWFSCAVMFGAVNLLSHRQVTLMKLFDALVAFSQSTLLLVLFCPISWCFLTV